MSARIIAGFGWGELLSPRYVLGAARHVMRMVWRHPMLRVLFILLLCLDGTLMALHWVHELGLDRGIAPAWLDRSRLDLDRHGSFSMMFDHAKSSVTVVLLGRSWWLTRAPAYLCSAVAFLIVLWVSASSEHAVLGEKIAKMTGLDTIYPEMGNHMIEAAFLAVVGLTLLGLIVIGALRSEGTHSVIAAAMAVAVAGLGFFAGGLDLFHALMFFELGKYAGISAFIEEAGEAVMLTIGCLFAAVAASRCAKLSRVR